MHQATTAHTCHAGGEDEVHQSNNEVACYRRGKTRGCFCCRTVGINATKYFTVSTSGTKRNYGEKGQNKTLTTTQPSTPSVKTSTQNSTMTTPTSDMIPSLDEWHCLSQEFPVLTSFNPSLLQRGSRVVNGVDLDCQLFNSMIDESVRLCAKLNKPLQFQYQNGIHGVRLIKLPMSKSNSGTVIPNIKNA